MSTHRHYTASAIVIGTGNRVLLIHHVKSGLWLPPGGHIEPGEAPAEAAVREVREETGLNTEIITGPLFTHPAVTTHVPPFTIIEATAADPVNGPHQHIDFLYVCRAVSGDSVQLDQSEATAARWVAPAELRHFAVPPELPELTLRALAWAARTPTLAGTASDHSLAPAPAAGSRDHHLEPGQGGDRT